LSGHLAPSAGEIRFDGHDIGGRSPQAINRLGLARSFQITNIFPKLSVFENIRLAVMRPHGVQYTFWKVMARDQAIRRETQRLLELVRLTARASTLAGEMAYSEQRSLEIAMTLACDPKLILLDEPMAGMNLEEKEDMARYIVDLNSEFGMTVIMIEHDMGVVMDISSRVMVLDFGKKIAEGLPEEVLANSHVKRAYLGEEDDVLTSPDDAPARETAA